MLDKHPFMFKQSKSILVVSIAHHIFLVIREQTNLLCSSSEASNEYGPSNIKWNKIQKWIIRKKINGRWETWER